MVQVIRAELSNLDEIAPLFDAYRQFYEQPADLSKAREFIKARLERGESTIFLALDEGGEALGFAQLYPTFCSVAAGPAFVLYDLFVAPEARRKGVATKLMDAARKLGEEAGAVWLKLDTAVTNVPGQSLYEKLGWERDNDFYAYYLHLSD